MNQLLEKMNRLVVAATAINFKSFFLFLVLIFFIQDIYYCNYKELIKRILITMF